MKERLYGFLAVPFPSSHFHVRSFRALEKLSKPYAFDVVVTSRPLLTGDLEHTILGQSAALVVRAGASARAIHGVVDSIISEGPRDDGKTMQHRLRLVPRFSLLRHTRGSRIFQDVTVEEVVTRVLKEHGIASRWRLVRNHPKRVYITQYEESTLDFVERLLCEAGIFYSFAQPMSLLHGLEEQGLDALSKLGPMGSAAAGAAQMGLAILEHETMLFADDASSYLAIDDGSALSTIENVAAEVGVPTEIGFGPLKVGLAAPGIHYVRAEGASVAYKANGTITSFRPRRAVRTNLAEFRDYDPDRPQLSFVARQPGDASKDGVSVGVDAKLSVDPTKGISASLSVDVSDVIAEPPLEDYRHHGNFHYPDWADAQSEPERQLLSRRRRADTAVGVSTSAALSPGVRFSLEGYPIGERNREYVVVRVKHRGSESDAERVYENEFECVPADVTFAPFDRRERRVHASLTATVVGPVGEEIWVDHQGRIKVKFHWDRLGAADGTSSCWIRSMQPWGGAGWGTQFIPRVGMEVVVIFDGGDPDRPLVIGSVYNGTHPMPFPVPGDRSRSGIRTSTIKNPQHFNELSFEDAAGREQVFVRAERDLDELVKHDHTLSVGADETIKISGNRKDHVLKNALLEVDADRDERVQGKASIDHHIRTDVVQRNLDQRVGETRTTRVGGRDDLEITGTAEERFLADLTTRVTGNFTIVVGKHQAPRALTLYAEGVTTLSTADTLELNAKKSIRITCGKTSIRIGEDGIELTGPLIRVTGEKGSMEIGKEGLAMKSEKVQAELSERLFVKTDATTLSMSKEIKLDGPKILLNSPNTSKEKPPPAKKPPTQFVLCDDNGRALSKQRFIIDLDDGSQRTGVTDDDGKASLDLPSGGKIRFPDLSEVSQA